MTHQYRVTGLTCAGCAATVEKALRQVPHVESVSVNWQQATATLSLHRHIPLHHLQQALASYPAYGIEVYIPHAVTDVLPPQGFWQDLRVWKRASLNTLNCLIGCSIGDFGMILYLQAYHPQTSMTVQMILAVVAGLFTSVMMETVLLKWREKFFWKFALQTAISMSFISMIAMELVMNTTDFMITGGKAAFDNPLYWTALVVAMAAGFLAPLPYNYYKLKKYNLACH